MIINDFKNIVNNFRILKFKRFYEFINVACVYNTKALLRVD